MDDETERFIAIRKIKLRRLHELDRQAAAMGEYNAPAHIEMERGSLRDELGMMDQAIAAPARSKVGDELGPAGRFLVYHQQNRETKQTIAAMSVELSMFIADSLEWRAMHRNWVLIISMTVILLLAVVVAGVTYVVTIGGL